MLFVLLAVHPQLTCCVMEALLMTQFKCSTKIQCKVIEAAMIHFVDVIDLFTDGMAVVQVLDSICILLHWSQVEVG